MFCENLSTCSSAISHNRERFVKHIVNVAITPIFAFFKRFDDRVVGRVKMFRRVFIGRRIAAADVTANFAESQMKPTVARFQTIFAAVCARRYFFNFFQVFASVHSFTSHLIKYYHKI
jgi:hypothetical protein